MLFSVEQAFVGRDETRAPLKTPAWEATKQRAQVNLLPFSYLGVRCKLRSRLGCHLRLKSSNQGTLYPFSTKNLASEHINEGGIVRLSR